MFYYPFTNLLLRLTRPFNFYKNPPPNLIIASHLETVLLEMPQHHKSLLDRSCRGG